MDRCSSRITPCFLSSENKNRREQPAERVENFAHRRLCCATTWRVPRIAIHAVFSDVDVEAAQIYSAKMIERVVDSVEFEFFICGPASADHFFQSLQNPAIDQAQIVPGVLVS